MLLPKLGGTRGFLRLAVILNGGVIMPVKPIDFSAHLFRG